MEKSHFKKIKCRFTIWSIPLLGTYPKARAETWADICAPMFTATLLAIADCGNGTNYCGSKSNEILFCLKENSLLYNTDEHLKDYAK